MNIPSYLFDLDGVLIDTESTYTCFWKTIQQEFVFNQADFCEVIKGNTIEFILEHFIQQSNREEVRRRFFQFEREMHYSLYPKALEVVQQLHLLGCKIAIVTSSDDVKMDAIRVQLPELFMFADYVLTATEMIKSKPAPDCWWQAAERLDTNIKDCIVLEDSINGLKSAYASGGYVIGVATGLPREIVARYSNKVINEISELFE